MISELKMTNAEQMNRLTCSLDEQKCQWLQQRSLLEQQHKQMMSEMSSRNEVVCVHFLAAALQVAQELSVNVNGM